jgi:serine protease Do
MIIQRPGWYHRIDDEKGSTIRNPRRRNTLKFNKIALLLAVMLVVAMAGCTAAATSPQPTATPAPTQTPTPYATPTSQPPPNTPTPSPSGTVLVPLPSFADLTALVERSVVAINTESVINTGFIQNTVEGAGSGWVYDASGVIVTNNHVVEGAKTISVQMEDGSTYTPVSVNTDPSHDLAVLKINAGALPALTVADASKLQVGDWVVTVGNALGQGISVTNGIVSRLGVSVNITRTETYTDLIETNAAINPGNSGGPLVNMSGEVVGITSLKLSSAGIEGMGYAIDMTEALPIIQKLSQ